MSLKINRHIVRTFWMLAPETVQLFKVLQGGVSDRDPQALFVGGCVRNCVLDIDVEDFDIATLHHPDAVIEILENAGIRVIPTGIEHGTVTAIIGEFSYEITTLRHDKETDGRHAVVAFTNSWVEDAKRRDFTINTLLMDLKGNIYDPLGSGLKDIDARRICFVGKAEQRIKEDYLRILRFFRFSALYGAGAFDKAGLAACEKLAKHVETLSKERITQEFFKIITSDKPQEVLKIMFEHDVLKTLDFSDYDAEFLEHFCRFQGQYRLGALSSRLFVCVGMNFINIKAMGEFILFPKVFLKDMKAIAGALNLSDLNCDQAVRESVYRFGRSATAQALMIELVQDRLMNAYAPKALDIIQNWEIPDCPVNGHDIMNAGIKAGPELGKKLKALEDFWIEHDFRLDRDICLKQL